MTSVLMRFPEERLATFTCSFGAADVSRYTLIGTKGSLTAEPAYDYSMGLETSHHDRRKDKHEEISPSAISLPRVDLLFRLHSSNKEPEPSGLEGLADVRIVRAIYESARTGRRGLNCRICRQRKNRRCDRRFTGRRMANPDCEC